MHNARELWPIDSLPRSAHVYKHVLSAEHIYITERCRQHTVASTFGSARLDHAKFGGDGQIL